MSTTEKFIRLQEELKPYSKIMSDANQQMLDGEVTKYPIFVIHQQQVELGVPLIKGEEDKWSVQASTLEEFAVKGLIQDHKIDDFRKVFKDPNDYFCLFVLSELGAQFIFIPQWT
jgi:hypothetical protein